MCLSIIIKIFRSIGTININTLQYIDLPNSKMYCKPSQKQTNKKKNSKEKKKDKYFF